MASSRHLRNVSLIFGHESQKASAEGGGSGGAKRGGGGKIPREAGQSQIDFPAEKTKRMKP